MSKESIVMAMHICPICGVAHTHNTEILIHKNLKNIPEDKRITGMGLCAEHEAKHKDGFVCLVGGTSANPEADRVTESDFDRSGRLVHVRREIWGELFDTPLDPVLPFVFVADEVITLITKMVEKFEQEGVENDHS